MSQPIGIIGAMESEVNKLLEVAEINEVQNHAGTKFYSITLSGVSCVVAQCNEGKVNSALCTQAMVDFYNPRLILNIGVAGGLGKDVHIGDVVIGTACVQYDYDATPLGCPRAEINITTKDGHTKTVFFKCSKEHSIKLGEMAESIYDGTVHYGNIATGDRFVADPDFGNWLNSTYGALACEMEGASIAHVCTVNSIPCVVLRSISDNANDSDTVDFRTFADDSAAKVQKLLVGAIATL